MKVVGIIAEYNPFHNGHAFQIQRIREMTQADYVVVAMSGDYVQRGTPAIIDKYVRTDMALSCGADLVIELPVLWATASAEYFATAGVTLFEKMGCVDMLCFGCECNDLTMLTFLADILADEPTAFKEALASYVKQGLAFPVARSKALLEYLEAVKSRVSCNAAQIDCSNTTQTASSYSSTQIAAVLDAPNNILAIEYMKALRLLRSHIQPLPIKREGSGYHDTNPTHPLASASAIRGVLERNQINLLRKCGSISDTTGPMPDIADSLFHVAGSMPANAYQLLCAYHKDYCFIESHHYSLQLAYLLRTLSVAELASYGDATDDIANRILHNLDSFRSYEQFCQLCKSRDVTYTRVCRILLHILLGIHQEDYSERKDSGYVPYLRVLGFRREAAPLLTAVKAQSTIPLITKAADAGQILSDYDMQLFDMDIAAGNLYESVLAIHSDKESRNEYTRQLVIRS